MDYPKISIVIPVYNTENYICQCLQSVVDQVYSNIECIIINDACLDNSEKIIFEFIHKYPQLFKYIKNTTNIGQGLCRNLGVDQVSSEYLYFLDSDDYLDKDCLLKMYTKLIECDSDFVISTFSLTRKISGQWVTTCRWDNYDELFEFSRYTLPMYVWGNLFKMSFWRNSGVRFESIMAEDLLVMMKIFSITNNIGILNQPLYVYRYNIYSLTHQFHSREEMQRVITKIYCYFKENNLLNDETIAFILTQFYNLLKGVASVFERRRFFKQFKLMIPTLPLDNKYFAPPLVNPSKKIKLTKIYASNGYYLLFRPDMRAIKRYIKKLFN